MKMGIISLNNKCFKTEDNARSNCYIEKLSFIQEASKYGCLLNDVQSE